MHVQADSIYIYKLIFTQIYKQIIITIQTHAHAHTQASARVGKNKRMQGNDL